MNKNLIGLISLLILMVIAIGCSGTNGISSPKIDNNDIVAMSSGTSVGNSQQLWGLWNIEIDTSTGQWTAIPLRTASFTANVNKILEAKPGNLAIQNLDLSQYLSDGILNCTVTLRHPFPGLSKYNGFDVWGVFMSNASTTLNYENLGYSVHGNSDEAVMLNPDGYTRWYNQPEFDGGGIPLFGYWPGKLGNLPAPSAVLNPYKIFADGLNAEDDYYQWITDPGNAADRGIFRAGASNSRRYSLQFPMDAGKPKLIFQYAVVATWEPGDPALTGDPAAYDAGDFPSSANVDEPFFINALTGSSDLFYIDSTTFGGTFKASLEIFDWQGGSVLGNGVPNEINRVILEGDFLPGGSQELAQSQLATVASAGTINSSVFQIDIPNCTPHASGDVNFWMIVESAGLNGATYGQGFPTMYPDVRRAAFNKGIVNISGEASEIIVSTIEPDHCPFMGSIVGADITGFGFKDGATVELRQAAQPSVVGANVVFMDSSHLKCDLDFANANSGKYDVVVINPDLQEGALIDGFTVDAWSDESLISTGSFRLPGMAQSMNGTIVLAVGQSDDTMHYMLFDPVTHTWAGPYLLNAGKGNDMITAIAADTKSNDVFYIREGWYEELKTFRYAGGTDEWEKAYLPVAGCRTMFLTVDSQGWLQVIDNTVDWFGYIYHFWAETWDAGYYGWHNTLPFDQFEPLGKDKLVLSEGNCQVYDSTGTMYTMYVYDEKYNNGNSAGPRSIMVNHIPLGGTATGQGFTKIEELSGDGVALDSPAITCMSDDTLHSAYRKFDTSTGMWKICHQVSTNQGLAWSPLEDIYSTTEVLGSGYVYIMADEQDHLSTLYINGKYFDYRNSVDGTTWAPVETSNPSAIDNPPGTSDFAPRAMISSDGVLHVVWIRGDASTGYGEVYHRMRDLY
jgi:hypothetical protein